MVGANDRTLQTEVSRSVNDTDRFTCARRQIFAVRANELFLMSQDRPLRSVHRSEGWTAEAIGTHAPPALRADFYPLERSQDVFNRDPL